MGNPPFRWSKLSEDFKRNNPLYDLTKANWFRDGCGSDEPNTKNTFKKEHFSGLLFQNI